MTRKITIVMLFLILLVLPSCAKPEQPVDTDAIAEHTKAQLGTELDCYFLLRLDENHELYMIETITPYESNYNPKALKKYHRLSYDTDGNFLYAAPEYFEKLEEYDNADGIFVTKSLYGFYMMKTDGSFENLESFPEENMPPESVIDRAFFTAEHLVKRYGIDISGIAYDAVTRHNDEVMK